MFKKTSFEPIKNPYIVGNPIKSDDMFFGREDDFNIIQNWIVHNGPHVIFLVGGRRSGKTSILWQIYRGKLKQAGETALCDFHAMVPRIKGNEDFPFEVGKSILENPIFADFKDDFFIDDNTSWTIRLQRLVDKCLKAIGQKKLIILCDEFEAIEDLFKNGVLSYDALLWVRQMLNLPVYFVMTGSHEFRDASIRNVFGVVSQKKPIYELSPQDALALIQRPIGDELKFKGDVTQAIYRLSGGHPFYTQYICHTLVNHVNAELRRNYVVTKDLDEVTDFIVNNPAGHIQETWKSFSNPNYAPQYTRHTLAALANAIQKPKDYISTADILQTIEKKRFKVDENSLYETLAWLKHNTRLLEWQGESYRFRIDLIRYWIAYSFQTGEEIELQDDFIPEPVSEEDSAWKIPPTTAPIPEENLSPDIQENTEEPVEESVEENIENPEQKSIAKTYAEKLELFLEDNIITLNERVKLDEFASKLGHAEVIETQVRTKLAQPALDWIKEYKESGYALKKQYSDKIPKHELKNLDNTYVRDGRVSKAKAKEIAKILNLQSGGLIKGLLGDAKKPVAASSKPVPQEGIPASDASSLTANDYGNKIENLLKANNSITVKDRILLDNLLTKLQLDVEQTVNIENEVRNKLNIDLIDWTQEYKESGHSLKSQYADKIPKSALQSLHNTYITPNRITDNKVKEIDGLLGLKAKSNGLLWIGSFIGIVIIAIVFLQFFNTPVTTPAKEVVTDIDETSKTEIYSVKTDDNKADSTDETTQKPIASSEFEEETKVVESTEIAEDVDNKLAESTIQKSTDNSIESEEIVESEETVETEETVEAEETTESEETVEADNKSDGTNTALVVAGAAVIATKALADDSSKETKNNEESNNPELEKKLAKCKEYFDKNDLTSSKTGGNAFDCYNEVLAKDSKNSEALDGLKKIEDKYVEWANYALDDKNVSKARANINKIQKVNPDSSELPKLKQRLDDLQIKARPEPRARPKPEPRARPKPEPRARPKPRVKPKPEPRAEPKPKPRAKPKPRVKPKPKPKPRAEPKPEPRKKPKLY